MPELAAAIDQYVAHHNINPKPFIWTKSAADILEKVICANSRLSSKQNATLHFDLLNTLRRAGLGSVYALAKPQSGPAPPGNW